MRAYRLILAIAFCCICHPCNAAEEPRPFSVGWKVINSGTEQDLWGVHFAGPETGWAVGVGGTIRATRDGGATWTAQTSGTEQHLNGVHFAGPGTGWAVGWGGTILATRDGGATWTAQTSGTAEALLGVHFAGPGTGWAVGWGGTILATRDGGATWTAQTSGTEQDLWGVHFAGPETGAIVGAAHTLLRSTLPNYSPSVDSVALKQNVDGSVTVSVKPHDLEDDTVTLDAWFATHKEAAFWNQIASSLTEKDGEWSATFNPGEPKFGSVAVGSPLYFKILLNDGGPASAARIWPESFPYQPWWVGIWRDHRATVLGAAGVIGVFLFYASILALLLWLRPVSLAHLGGSTTLDEIGEATGAQHRLQALVRIGTRVIFNPWITTRRRVRSAWINAYQNKSERFADLGSTVRTNFLDHADVLDGWVERRVAPVQGALEHFDLFRQRRLYVALPIRMGDPETGQLVEQPSPEAFRPVFEQERVVLPIVGVGGSGKSTLACALARWALSATPGERLTPWRMLPVFVGEETQDLVGSIQRTLAAMVGGEEVEADIVRALLRSKRLLVIVDALSERSPETQRHVSEFYGSGVPLNALVLTTRREPKFGQLDRTPVYTERLVGPTLIPFIFEYLRRRQLEGAFDQRQQLKLGDRVLALVEAGGRALSVTPLLVTLFVESALARSREHQSLDALPASVPEVYLDYLRRLNPNQSVTPDAVDETTIIRAARVLARFSLGRAFIPSDIRRDAAKMALAEAGFDVEPKLLVDRLIANGVIEERQIGGTQLLRFALDPVAEHLAAIEAVHELGSDQQAWADAFAMLRKTSGYPTTISGFLNALGDCYVTYREPFRLPDLKLPWQNHDVTRHAA